VLETVEALFAERARKQNLGLDGQAGAEARKPGFSESYYGFRTFSKLLDEAAARKLLEVEHDEKSGRSSSRTSTPSIDLPTFGRQQRRHTARIQYNTRMPKILAGKTSSLGDVVHNLPMVSDILACFQKRKSIGWSRNPSPRSRRCIRG